MTDVENQLIVRRVKWFILSATLTCGHTVKSGEFFAFDPMTLHHSCIPCAFGETNDAD